MKPKILLPTLAVVGVAAMTAAATQNPFTTTNSNNDNAKKIAIFNKLTQGPSGGDESDACVRQAWVERKAANRAVKADFMHNLANCVNISDLGDQMDCVLDAFDTLDEESELVLDQFDARLDLCAATGGGYYEPEIDPENFVKGIDNPFWPQNDPNTTLIYELKTLEGEFEEIHVSPTGGTIEILGVECTVVRDQVWIDGVLHEDTLDYYAQDVDGNVWYFGEIAVNFDENGNLADVEGSWTAGQDEAHPGILVWANPVVGTTYRQEFLLGEAEDAGTILGLDAVVDVPYGHFENCIHTADFTPLDPEANEEKFYAKGIGVVLEFDPATGEKLELVDIVVDEG